MLSLATSSQDDLSLMKPFSRREISVYIRHLLREVPLEDPSLVDHFIDLAGSSFTGATFACALVRFGPANTSHDCIQVLLGHRHHSLPVVVKGMFSKLLERCSLQNSPYSTNNSPFHAIVRSDQKSPDLCDLHLHIVLGCLRTMDEMLRFNICNIPSSYMPNSDAQVEQHFQDAQRKGVITCALVYACLHWPHHASFVSHYEDLKELVISFLETHALHWLEIISLVGQDPMKTLSRLNVLRVSSCQYSSSSAFGQFNKL